MPVTGFQIFALNDFSAATCSRYGNWFSLPLGDPGEKREQVGRVEFSLSLSHSFEGFLTLLDPKFDFSGAQSPNALTQYLSFLPEHLKEEWKGVASLTCCVGFCNF